MMKISKKVTVLTVALLFVLSFTMGAYAASNLENIQAYLNKGVTIKYNNVEQTMTDSNGKRVYPITFKGTTYLPVRAVSNMMGIDVTWDADNNTVALGQYGSKVKDLIEDIGAYGEEGVFGRTGEYKISDNDSISIGGSTIDHYLAVGYSFNYGGVPKYNLEGKYKTLKFEVFCADTGTDAIQFGVYDEEAKELVWRDSIQPQDHKSVTVDVTGLKRISFHIAESTGYYYGITVE